MEVAASARACLVADVGGTNARVGWTLDGQSVQDVVAQGNASEQLSMGMLTGKADMVDVVHSIFVQQFAAH